ncbi:hypothetical protein [Microbulbifer taiwanensis]|uniref:Uncharacterized protein n=1 Tax=Microbulbifer taiwanensis TaxID=986746 RepID=A0ABW1YRT3_9GAMM|nr:hypothetical protein [Microbulbifer taiwanensis]
MGYGKPAAWGLLCSVGLIPVCAGAADSTSASASARITLQIAPRVQLRQVEGSSRQQLCLGHIPARHYYLLVIRGSSDGGRQLPGRGGSFCLPVSVTEGAGELLIVAQ